MTPIMKLEKLVEVNMLPNDLAMHNLPANYWGNRCVLQLQYICKLSLHHNNAYDKEIFEAIEIAWDAYKNEGAITKVTTQKVESMLSKLQTIAKNYSLLCIGHAHIDMNWMWGYSETTSITLDTLRTMLNLMEEYPEYTYAQSQASVYRIVEKHAPEMIDEIKKRIQEGRWEVTASTWVEADKNMPSQESMARHLLYTKQYLSKLLDIKPESLNIDYEPDTFGHSVNVPEILSDGGVKYYYHCRGYDEHVLYNWAAPSGRKILVFREPSWYNWTIDGREALLLPEFSQNYGLDSMLRVYGVGDHGGGPTRRDIEKIIDMNTWPLFPQYKFGTYSEFYAIADKNKENYATVEGELNFIFDGCYTTQTRIKKGNKHGEMHLCKAEAISALGNIAINTKYDTTSFAQGWKNILFNQFHDILTGSGVVDTREHAMGLYQETFAITNTAQAHALRAISDATDTSMLGSGEDISETRSEGAGVGYGLDDSRVAQLSRHAGTRRPFTVFNPLSYNNKSLVEVSIWDWNNDLDRMEFTGSDGQLLSHQIVSSELDNYWGHLHTEVLVEVDVPAMGYTNIVLDTKSTNTLKPSEEPGPRVMKAPIYILENDLIKVELDKYDGSIISYIDKKTGEEFADKSNPMGVFKYIKENTKDGMSAWIVGQYMETCTLNKGVKFTKRSSQKESIRQSISYEKSFSNDSKIMICLSLDIGEALLRIDAKIHWHELGKRDKFFPQISFAMPVSYTYDSFRYDIPMGTVERKCIENDVPAQSYGMPINKSGKSLMLISDCKYGYRGNEDGLSLTLIRSSIDPDPWPEIGEHVIHMAIALSDNNIMNESAISDKITSKPMVASTSFHKGVLPNEQSLIELVGDIKISSIKLAEDSQSLVIRYYEQQGQNGSVSIKLLKAPKVAYPINLLEEKIDGNIKINNNSIKFEYSAYSIGSILVKF